MGLKIAILGTRGIPANYGGFETFAEQISERLTEFGHDVVVYGRFGRVGKKDVSGKMQSVLLPSIKTKHLETVSHTAISATHAILNKCDVAIVCNLANAPILPMLKIAGIKTLLLVDGFESKRAKWGNAGRSWLAYCEKFARFVPDMIVTDAQVIFDYWQPRSKSEVTMIPYGVDELDDNSTTGILDKLSLKPEQYFLYVSRLEPENNALLVAKSFQKVKTDKKLVIVGDAPYAKKYIKQVKSVNDDRIIFPGAIYGKAYQELMKNCFVYIQATEVGGTHPALLEGLCWSPMVIAHDTPENREVAKDSALFFKYRDEDDLARCIQMVENDNSIIHDYQKLAKTHVREKYIWNEVTKLYDRLCCGIVSNK